jgi:hypothetical protein
VLRHAAARANGLDALVYVGAYMAGLSNEQVAAQLVDALRTEQPDKRAVVFFDTSTRE